MYRLYRYTISIATSNSINTSGIRICSGRSNDTALSCVSSLGSGIISGPDWMLLFWNSGYSSVVFHTVSKSNSVSSSGAVDPVRESVTLFVPPADLSKLYVCES